MKKIILMLMLIGPMSCSKSTLIDYPMTRSYEEYEVSDSTEVKDTIETNDSISGIPITFNVNVED
jgi:hypothetical protein